MDRLQVRLHDGTTVRLQDKGGDRTVGSSSDEMGNSVTLKQEASTSNSDTVIVKLEAKQASATEGRSLTCDTSAGFLGHERRA